MHLPLVSVIIPTYNAINFIEQTLHSVFSQTYKELEVICVDNNSKDDTLLMIEQLQQQHKWKFKILHELKQGAPFARNLGLQHASGEYVQFLDSDDFLLPKKLETQVKIFAETSVDFMTADHVKIINGVKKYKKRNFTNLWQGLITGGIGITSSALFRRSALNSVGGFDTSLTSNQEKDLYFRLIQKGHTHFHLAEPVFEKNFHDNSISNSTQQKTIMLNMLHYLGRIKNYLIENGEFNQYEKLLTTRYIHLLERYFNQSSVNEVRSFEKDFGKYSIFNSNFSISKKIAIKLIGAAYFFIPIRL